MENSRDRKKRRSTSHTRHSEYIERDNAMVTATDRNPKVSSVHTTKTKKKGQRTRAATETPKNVETAEERRGD